MNQTFKNSDKSKIRMSYQIIKAASLGNSEAMTLILRKYDPYIRKLATISVAGTYYLNRDLYEQLKAKLVFITATFKC